MNRRHTPAFGCHVNSWKTWEGRHHLEGLLTLTLVIQTAFRLTLLYFLFRHQICCNVKKGYLETVIVALSIKMCLFNMIKAENILI